MTNDYADRKRDEAIRELEKRVDSLLSWQAQSPERLQVLHDRIDQLEARYDQIMQPHIADYIRKMTEVQTLTAERHGNYIGEMAKLRTKQEKAEYDFSVSVRQMNDEMQKNITDIKKTFNDFEKSVSNSFWQVKMKQHFINALVSALTAIPAAVGAVMVFLKLFLKQQ